MRQKFLPHTCMFQKFQGHWCPLCSFGSATWVLPSFSPGGFPQSWCCYTLFWSTTETVRMTRYGVCLNLPTWKLACWSASSTGAWLRRIFLWWSCGDKSSPSSRGPTFIFFERFEGNRICDFDADTSKAGFKGEAFDLKMDTSFDILAAAGFAPGSQELKDLVLSCWKFCLRLALQAIRRSKPGAIHVMALACNSFCLPCRSQNSCAKVCSCCIVVWL